MSRQDATLNLASLLKHDLEAEVDGSGLLMPDGGLLEADGLRLAAPLSWQLTVRRAGGDDDFILTGEVSGTAVQECRRCLTDVETSLHTDLIYPMEFRPSKGKGGLTLLEQDDAEDVLIFGQPEVDFGPLLTQVFAIDLPLTALCKESCKGLSLDGVNLNEHPEYEDVRQDEAKSSPFEALKDLDL